MVMLTGKDPGSLGIYGFRHRKGYSYHEGYIVNSTHVKAPCVWDILGKKGFRSTVIGIPPSYPPKALNGNMISCMITPSHERQFTFPNELKMEVERIVGRYMFDVTFRVEDREKIKQELFEMTGKRFRLACYLARNKPWDLFILHEIGFDRLHHAFWKFFDPQHPKYTEGNPYEAIAEEYYTYVDARIGELLETVGADTSVLVISDHGSKAMTGALCINQWLEQEGFLKFKSHPAKVSPIDECELDWSKTVAWGWGGYYARIFLNVHGREPEGIVARSHVDAVKEDLKDKVRGIKDSSGRTLQNRVLEPETIYRSVQGDSPDLMVYLDDLNWRSAGTVGHESMYLTENDTGPDDSVHTMDGVFTLFDPEKRIGGKLNDVRALDIAPTILALFGCTPGDHMQGSSVLLD